ncbi:MAG: phosphatase PAP2 family protein [Patescibacteria group bacterium]|jgi:undecaprenyl-diphosphatase
MRRELKKGIVNITAGIAVVVLLRVLVVFSSFVQHIDQALYAIVISFRTTVLTTFMRGVTVIGLEGIVAVGIAFLGFFLLQRRYTLVVRLAALLVGTYIAQDATKLFFNVPRPPISYWLVAESSSSFPSGHALGATVLFGFIYWLIARSGVHRFVCWSAYSVAIVIIFLVGLSRIYLGVHWPSDVIAGWILGFFWLRAVLR